MNERRYVPRDTSGSFTLKDIQSITRKPGDDGCEVVLKDGRRCEVSEDYETLKKAYLAERNNDGKGVRK